MARKRDFSKRLLVGITGFKENHWKSKLKEIDRFGITKVSLFLERFEKKQRNKIYDALLKSDIKEIPLVHIRNDMSKKELDFLFDKFSSRYFTIHESSFRYLKKWKGYYKYLYLEMNTDNFVSQSIKVSRIGGFCVDLAHFKIEATKWSEEFEYIFERRDTSHYFDCNHLNGYDPDKNMDMHTVSGIKDFDFLKTIPEFLFGDFIGLEMNNCIEEQLRYRKYLIWFLNELFL